MIRPGWSGAFVVALAVTSAACGGSSNPPPSTSNPSPGGERISGSERLGWNQPAVDAAELATFRYVAYVDGARAELADVACTGLVSGTSACNSRMPAMTPGSHSIELASFVVDGGTVVESGRSAPLRVTVTGATAAAGPPATAASRLLITSDGAELRRDALSDQLAAPTAIAIAPDGRLFVAEQEGRIRLVRNGVLETEPAIILDDVLMTSAGEGGLLTIALDADFDRTHFLYALYTVSGPEDSRRFRLVRLREVDGRLGERVVLLDDVAAATRPAAALAVGPDRRLYVALDAPLAGGRAPAAASYSGKVLRLDADGTTPRDQPGGSPVFAADVQSPRGLAWHPISGALWLADVTWREAEELRVIAAASGAGSAPSSRQRVSLPAGTGAAGVAFYRGTLVPAFVGDLFVAAADGRALLRLSFDRRDSTRLVSSERLLQDADGRIRAVAIGADGLVYVATERALLRVGPR